MLRVPGVTCTVFRASSREYHTINISEYYFRTLYILVCNGKKISVFCAKNLVFFVISFLYEKKKKIIILAKQYHRRTPGVMTFFVERRTAKTSDPRHGQRFVDQRHGQLDDSAAHVRRAAVPAFLQIRERKSILYQNTA